MRIMLPCLEMNELLFWGGTTVFAEVRGQRLPLQVAATPFVPNAYKR